MELSNIDDRYKPNVAGVDLEHSLNYISAQGLDLEWFYRSYTHKHLLYRRGSRPGLETFLEQQGIDLQSDDLSRLQGICEAVYATIVHYSLLGYSGKTDRGLSEENLLLYGKGWCNEQARVLLALLQVAGIPARLVFAAMEDLKGHVLTEAWIHDQWVLVDQTCRWIFTLEDERLLNVYDLKTDTGIQAEAGRRYRDAMQQDRKRSRDPEVWDRLVPYGVVGDGLALFHSVGFCNYFIH